MLESQSQLVSDSVINLNLQMNVEPILSYDEGTELCANVPTALS